MGSHAGRGNQVFRCQVFTGGVRFCGSRNAAEGVPYIFIQFRTFLFEGQADEMLLFVFVDGVGPGRGAGGGGASDGEERAAVRGC